jgi:type IV pilus assembly protein PilM
MSFLNSFLNGVASPLGLDISELSVKFVQLENTGKKINIRALGKINLPKGLWENGEIKDKKEIAKAIRKLISHPDYGKVNTHEAVICLPEGKTFLKIIEVEKEGDQKHLIESELQKNVPLPLEDLYYDWQKIGESGKSNLILAGAAPQKIVEEQIELLNEARLSAAAIETEPISVCRCLLKEENPNYKATDHKNYAIIDIGATDSSLTVYSRNTIIFSMSMPVSGEELDAQIAKTLNIDHVQAEKVKILYGLDEHNDQPAVKKIIAEMVKNLIERSKEAINFFNHHFISWGPIEKIILCGGGASIKNLDKMIAREIGIETELGYVFVNFQGNKNNFFSRFRKTFGLNTDFLTDESGKKIRVKQSLTLKISHDTSLCYATAIGLALRGIFIDE